MIRERPLGAREVTQVSTTGRWVAFLIAAEKNPPTHAITGHHGPLTDKIYFESL